MVGQSRLISKLNSYNINSFPRSILLLGELGSGKHLMASQIASRFNIPLTNITENISEELILEIYNKSIPSAYLVDMNSMTEKEQNVLLKLVEEPTSNTFIILISESKTNILPTILNRCIAFEMDPYSKEELETFIKNPEDKDIVLSVLNTPGQIMSSNLINIRDMLDLCSKIVDKIELAGYSNALSIANKINFKDEYDKFDIYLVFRMLIKLMWDKVKTTSDKKYIAYYELTMEERKKLSDKRLNLQSFMYNYLTKLWRLSKNGL